MQCTYRNARTTAVLSETIGIYTALCFEPFHTLYSESTIIPGTGTGEMLVMYLNI